MAAGSAGCLPHDRLINRTCEWSDSAFVADTANPSHRWHVDRDVEIAEELGVRYGDTFRRQLGVAGLGKKQLECTNRLLGAVARVHGLTLAYVSSRRGHRDWRFDALAILLPCAMLIVAGTWLVSRRITVAMPVNARRLALLLSGLLAIGVTGASMLLADYWGLIAENRRVDDGHISYRSAYRVMATRPFEIFVGGLLLAWITAGATVAVVSARPVSRSAPHARRRPGTARTPADRARE